jgi:erythromycin esterase-like protein
MIEDAVRIELDGQRGDIDSFAMLDDLAAAARFAFLVEPEHCIHERHEFRLLCSRYLAARGWTWFGEEADWRWGERVDSYLATGDESLLDADDTPRFTSGMLAPAFAAAPTAALHAERQRAARAMRGCLGSVRSFGFDGSSDPEYLKRGDAIATIEDLQAFMAWREKRMHERVAEVALANPTAKVALMAGGAHLAKTDAKLRTLNPANAGGRREVSIGHYVTHTLSEGPVLSIWLLYGGGRTASPYVPGGELAVGASTLNANLAKRWTEPRLARVDGDTDEYTLESFGPIACRLSDQIDAIVFCPRVTPVHE